MKVHCRIQKVQSVPGLLATIVHKNIIMKLSKLNKFTCAFSTFKRIYIIVSLSYPFKCILRLLMYNFTDLPFTTPVDQIQT